MHMQIRIQQWLHPNRGLKYLWIQNPKIVPASVGLKLYSDIDLRMQKKWFLDSQCVWCMEVNAFLSEQWVYQCVCISKYFSWSLSYPKIKHKPLNQYIGWACTGNSNTGIQMFVVCCFKSQHKLRTSIIVEVLWDIGTSN